MTPDGPPSTFPAICYSQFVLRITMFISWCFTIPIASHRTRFIAWICFGVAMVGNFIISEIERRRKKGLENGAGSVKAGGKI